MTSEETAAHTAVVVTVPYLVMQVRRYLQDNGYGGSEADVFLKVTALILRAT
jgi:hypothetical protein